MTAARRLALVLAGACTLGCGAPAPRPRPEGEIELSEEVAISPLAPGVWRFVARAPALSAIAGFPANGLVIDREAGSVLVDTGWSAEHAEALARWAEDRGHPIEAAIVTHFHDDRIGGAAALEARGVPVFATDDTAARAAAIGTPLSHRTLEDASIPELSWLFPGAGHSPDNIVVVHPASHTLFGGCFVKSAYARDLGNLFDADVAAWREAIDRVIARYPDARQVVPGHGEPGGVELLTHTRDLLDAAQ